MKIKKLNNQKFLITTKKETFELNHFNNCDDEWELLGDNTANYFKTKQEAIQFLEKSI